MNCMQKNLEQNIKYGVGLSRVVIEHILYFFFFVSDSFRCRRGDALLQVVHQADALQHDHPDRERQLRLHHVLLLL
jgi:hypothetical protein